MDGAMNDCTPTDPLMLPSIILLSLIDQTVNVNTLKQSEMKIIKKVSIPSILPLFPIPFSWSI